MPQTMDMVAVRSRQASGAPAWPSVILCIPTFRRPEGLEKLLTHVGALSYKGPLSVIVVENDAEQRAGAAVVARLAPGFRFGLGSIDEPRRGQTYAYNRGFVTAACALPRPDYVAILDDDEYPDPAWLTRMVTTASSLDADIVGGPVLPVFDDPHHWLAKSGFYAPRRYASGRVDMIYGAGSMLAKRSVIEDYLDEPFSHAFAFTGGSDLEFFERCRRDGRSFAWADTALVFETTPRSRTTLTWLLRRNFRKGSERARIDRASSPRASSASATGARTYKFILRFGRGLALVAVGALSLPLAAFRGRGAAVAGLNRIARGAGRIAAEFNLFYDEYR
jgi:glycosyltransferase involved in cell wall biosynthesis